MELVVVSVCSPVGGVAVPLAESHWGKERNSPRLLICVYCDPRGATGRETKNQSLVLGGRNDPGNKTWHIERANLLNQESFSFLSPESEGCQVYYSRIHLLTLLVPLARKGPHDAPGRDPRVLHVDVQEGWGISLRLLHLLALQRLLVAATGRQAQGIRRAEDLVAVQVRPRLGVVPIGVQDFPGVCVQRAAGFDQEEGLGVVVVDCEEAVAVLLHSDFFLRKRLDEAVVVRGF